MRLKLVSVASVILMSLSSGAFAATELCMAIDGSGSVGSSNFDILKEGTAAAVEDASVIPQNSSVIFSVVQFGVGAQIDVTPTTIDSQITADAVAAEIRAIAYLGGGDTNMVAALQLCEEQFSYGSGDKQVIDMVTDGQPGIGGDPGTNGVSDSIAALGVDAINALGVGGGANATQLNGMVRAQPANAVGEGDGFVVLVAAFEDFLPAIAAKLQAEVNQTPPAPVPTLSQWALILMVLMLAGMAVVRIRGTRVS